MARGFLHRTCKRDEDNYHVGEQHGEFEQLSTSQCGIANEAFLVYLLEGCGGRSDNQMKNDSENWGRNTTIILVAGDGIYITLITYIACP